jgi:hypothetical protein
MSSRGYRTAHFLAARSGRRKLNIPDGRLADIQGGQYHRKCAVAERRGMARLAATCHLPLELCVIDPETARRRASAGNRPRTAKATSHIAVHAGRGPSRRRVLAVRRDLKRSSRAYLDGGEGQGSRPAWRGSPSFKGGPRRRRCLRLSWSIGSRPLAWTRRPKSPRSVLSLDTPDRSRSGASPGTTRFPYSVVDPGDGSPRANLYRAARSTTHRSGPPERSAAPRFQPGRCGLRLAAWRCDAAIGAGTARASANEPDRRSIAKHSCKDSGIAAVVPQPRTCGSPVCALEHRQVQRAVGGVSLCALPHRLRGSVRLV